MIGMDAASTDPPRTLTRARRAALRRWPYSGPLAGTALLFAVVITVLLAACGDDSSGDAAPLPSELVAAGRAIYSGADGDRGCAGCHGADATGARAEGIVGASASSIREGLEIPAMSSIELTDEQVDALAAYLRSLDE